VRVEIYRLEVDPANVARLLELRRAAMAGVPELRQADLVRLDERVWLDIRIWVGAVDAGLSSPAYTEMERLFAAQLGHDRGERVHTTGTAWAAGR
jgi:hypothetical protein